MARRSKMTDARIEALLNALRIGNTRRAAIAHANISPDTFYRWLNADRTFSDAIEKAEGEAESHYLAIIFRAATVTWQAAAWWLERRRRQDFALGQKVEMSGPDGKPIETRSLTEDLSDEDRRRLRQAIDEVLAQERQRTTDAASAAEAGAAGRAEPSVRIEAEGGPGP